jgi:rhamnosyltransferase
MTGSAAATRTTVGVVIRTLNESELIGQCFDALHSQSGSFDLDIVVVDSGSTDGTVEIAREHGGRIIELPPVEFDYSKALNVGIDAVRGGIVVSLSAHAIPVDDTWLDTVVAAFDAADVAGVSTRQVPWPDAPWQEVHRVRSMFRRERTVYGPGNGADVFFSNAASAFRRDVWSDHPFTLPAVEDVDWARRVVAAGWSIVYEPATAVYHSHHESARAQARRMIDISRAHLSAGDRQTRLRTVRAGAAFLLRDARRILELEEPSRRKLSYLAELVATVWFYVLDFSRSGTTAERRREEASPR